MRLAMTIRTFPRFQEMNFVSRREIWTEYSVWESVEVSTALLCANLPPMTTVLRHAFRRLASTVHWPGSSPSSSPAETGRTSGEKDSSHSKTTCNISKQVCVDIEQGYVDQSMSESRHTGGNINNGGATAAAAVRGAQVSTDVAPWEGSMLEPPSDSVQMELPIQQATSTK